MVGEMGTWECFRGHLTLWIQNFRYILLPFPGRADVQGQNTATHKIKISRFAEGREEVECGVKVSWIY
jgi:hypothetical protein